MNPTTAKLVANVQIVLNKQLWMDSVFYFVVLYPHRIYVGSIACGLKIVSV